jgi:hypothetical protein
MKLENSRQISAKSPKMTFHENPSSGSRVVPCGLDERTDGQTGRHDKANSRFSQFFECTQKEISVNRNNVTQGSDLWRPVINLVINISISKKAKFFFKCKRLATFQRRLLFHEIRI